MAMPKAPAGPKVLYRIVRRPVADARDFTTKRAKGRIPPAGATADEIKSYDSLSAFDRIESARALARITTLGNYIAVLHIYEETPINAEYTGKHHYDLFGAAEDFVRATDRVEPV